MNKQVIYEELFYLLEYCNGFTYEDALRLPVSIRKWWLNRKAKDNEEKQDARDRANGQQQSQPLQIHR